MIKMLYFYFLRQLLAPQQTLWFGERKLGEVVHCKHIKAQYIGKKRYRIIK